MIASTPIVAELWDAKPFVLSPASNLYHLEPIGVGTAFVESLSSYLLRLAEAHSVLPFWLFRYVQENTAETRGLARHTMARDYALNAHCGLTQRWVSTLTLLTQRPDLRFLTLLPWQDLFSRAELMRRRLAWCPACFQEWNQRGHPLYLPLIWFLRAVSICPRHRQPLQGRCWRCQQPQRILTSTLWLGYCAHCGAHLDQEWTAAEGREEATQPGAAGPAEQQWTAQAVGSLLAAAPTLARLPDRSILAKLASQCISYLGQRNPQASARCLGVPPATFQDWRNGYRTTLATFLAICYRLDSSPLDVLTEEGFCLQPTSPTPTNEVLSLSLAVKPHQPKSRQHLDQEKLARDLIDLLAVQEIPPPRVQEVAQRIGCSATTIYRNFPAFYQCLLERRQAYIQGLAREKWRAVTESLAAAMAEWPPLSIRQTAVRLGHQGPWLSHHFPQEARLISERYQAYQAAQAQETIKQWRQKLEEELHSQEWPPPTVKAVLRRLKCSARIAYQHCPEQCHALARRYAAYRREQSKERQQAIRDQVRQAALALHGQGRYPSKSQVTRQLANPLAMRTVWGREAYDETMNELGYGGNRFISENLY